MYITNHKQMPFNLSLWNLGLNDCAAACRNTDMFANKNVVFCINQGLYKVLKVLEFDFLKFKSWKTLENSHIYEKVLECLKGSIYEISVFIENKNSRYYSLRWKVVSRYQ